MGKLDARLSESLLISSILQSISAAVPSTTESRIPGPLVLPEFLVIVRASLFLFSGHSTFPSINDQPIAVNSITLFHFQSISDIYLIIVCLKRFMIYKLEAKTQRNCIICNGKFCNYFIFYDAIRIFIHLSLSLPFYFRCNHISLSILIRLYFLLQ